jgi:hypothetical protein
VAHKTTRCAMVGFVSDADGASSGHVRGAGVRDAYKPHTETQSVVALRTVETSEAGTKTLQMRGRRRKAEKLQNC